MRRQDFHYDLPAELIAQYPINPRHASRLLVFQRETQTITHRQQVLDMVDYLQPGDLLVFNNTKVLPARFYAKKITGGQVEVLVERLLTDTTMLCHMRASKAAKPGSQIIIDESWRMQVLGRSNDLFEVEVNGSIVDMLHTVGHMPLPPYIERPDEESDLERYQTVYAKHLGSVAAPTAGLHFDQILLNKIQEKQVHMNYVTLHVGAGTFQPVRADELKDHVMHFEWYDVSSELVEQIHQTHAQGRRVFAIGTTALRALESAARDDFKTLKGLTNLFITPGYTFKVIDGLMTNFHLPESTLLMLVAALIGHSQMMKVYEEAVRLQYRFFSYGDACLFF